MTAADADADAALVVDADPLVAGAAVRAHLDHGRRAAGFVGDPDGPAVAEFLSDVVSLRGGRRA